MKREREREREREMGTKEKEDRSMHRDAETSGFGIFARVSSPVRAIPVIPGGYSPLEESYTRDFFSPCKRKQN